METKEIELRLTVAEVSGILHSLGQMPYSQVVSLVLKIQQQTRQQVPDI